MEVPENKDTEAPNKTVYDVIWTSEYPGGRVCAHAASLGIFFDQVLQLA